MFYSTKQQTVILATLPLALLLIGVVLIASMYPLHINSNAGFGPDPAYQYLFAGVDILQGQSPVHTDHPGTPLQTLIAGIIATTWFVLHSIGATSAGVFDSVLLTPEVFLCVTSIFLLTLTCLASFYLGRAIYKVTQSLSMALACQVSPLLYPIVIPNVVFPTPEALLISVSLTLLAVLVPLTINPTNQNEPFRKSTACWAGLLCGLGLATKLTFVPMLGLLLLFKRPRLIAFACFWVVAAWLIGVLPIIPRLTGMFGWFYSLLTHSGIHGAGGATVFDLGQVKMAIGWLIDQFSVFYLSLLALFSFFVLSILSKISQLLGPVLGKLMQQPQALRLRLVNRVSGADLSTVSILLLVLIIQTLMVAKHLGPTYMIPALPIPLLGIAWLLHQQTIVPFSHKTRATLSGICLVVLLTVASFSILKAIKAVSNTHQQGMQSQRSIQHALKQFDDPLMLGAFNCNFLECALWFGMGLVPEMELKTAAIMPNFYYFDIFSKKLHLPGKGELSDQQTAETMAALMRQTRPVLLISPPFPHLAKLKLELLLSTPIQNLYRVTGLQ
jgi:hypothetical protein